MTEPRDVHAEHLDAATIAALVDRTLEPAARAAAEAHLAACADCREVWVETSEIEGEMSGAARPGLRRAWIYGAAGLAAAVVLGTSVFLWRTSQGPTLEASIAGLVDDVGTGRFTTGRLSADFAWGEPPSAQRSGANAEPPLAVQRRAIELQEFAQHERNARTLHAAGLGLLAMGRTEDAIKALTDATRLDPSHVAGHVDLSVALLERARAGGDTSDAVNALDAARRALELAPSDRAAQFNYALTLETMGLRREAIDAWKRYLASDATSAWAREAETHIKRLEADGERQPSLSGLYHTIDRERLPAWSRAVLSGQTPADLTDLAVQLSADHVDPWLKRVVGEAAKHPATCLANALSATATWHAAFEAGLSEESLAAADRAARGFRCAGLPETDALARRAVSLIELGRLDEADAAAARAVQESSNGQFRRAAARALQIRGLVAFQRGVFGTATQFIGDAVTSAEAARDVEFAVSLRTILGSAYEEQGDMRESWRQAQHALGSLHTITSQRRRYAVLSSAAVRAQSFELRGAALAFADALLTSIADWENPVGRAFAHLQRAEAYERFGRPDLGRQDLETAKGLLPAVTSDAVRRDLDTNIQMTSGLTAPTPAVAITSLTRVLERLDQTSSAAFQAPALLARGRAYRSSGLVDQARSDWLRGLDVVEDQRQSIREAQLRVSRLDRVWDLYSELIRLHRDSALRSLEFAERGRARQLLDSMGRGASLQPARGAGLFEFLRDPTAAIVYASLDDELFVWYITARGVSLETKRISRDRLAFLVDDYRQKLIEGVPAFSDELSRLLVPSAFTASAVETLLIAPDGPLHRLPFAAIRAPGSQAFLVEQTTPVIIASLTTARQVPAAIPASEADVLLVGVARPPASTRLPILGGVEAELAGLRTLYPHARVVEGPSAEPARVRALLPSARVIHVAAHAVVEPRFPSRSRLILADSPAGHGLSVLDIAETKLRRGTTVVLGACETAIGTITRSEGVAALTRAFLTAGASAVIGALWPVNDRDASAFLIDLHRALSRDEPAARALSEAQRVAIRSGRSTRTWAGFQAAGGLEQKELRRVED